MSTLPHLQPGMVFAHDYRVIRPLAEGGMGAVYIVEQLSTGHQRALKVMHPQLLSDPKQRDRFAQEARVGSQIKSAHVVEVAAAGIDGPTQTPWIAMELLEGDDLAAIMKRRGALPANEVSEIFEQLGDALGKAHAAGIVHRDLKPENVFIATSRLKGVPFVAKVLDFGISRIIAEHKTAATVTSAIGSPLWMAPEQTHRGAKIRASTDVWPLGLLAFHLLTGRYYWLGANVPDEEFNLSGLLVEIMVTALDPASTRAAERAALLPPGFDPWFARCLDRNPDARFRDASEAVAALLPLLSSTAAAPMRTMPVYTPTPTASAQTQPALGPTPWNATVPAETAYRASEASHHPPPPRSSGAPLLAAVSVGLCVLALGAGAMVFATKRTLSSQPPAARPIAAPGDPLAAPTPVVPRAPEPAAPEPVPVEATPTAPSAPRNPPPSNDNFASQVSAVWRRNLGGIRACYERAERNNPALPSGRLVAHFTIGANGRVTDARTTGFEDTPEFGQCVTQRVQNMVFPAPSGGDVQFEMPMNFSNSARTESTPATPPPAATPPPETPSRNDIMAAMRPLRDPIAACANGTGFSGTITATVTFASSGATSTVAASGATPAINACAARVARSAHVPPFTRASFTVSYPFAVSSTPPSYRNAQW